MVVWLHSSNNNRSKLLQMVLFCQTKSKIQIIAMFSILARSAWYALTWFGVVSFCYLFILFKSYHLFLPQFQAIASMGGAFIDCNKLFCQLSNYTKQEICAMTIFNLTARQDLQHAFDLISQMLSAPTDAGDNTPTNNTTCVLRGALKHRSDLGLSVTLIKGEDAVAKCFCVTLVLNPISPFDNSRPVPATIECAYAGQQQIQGAKAGGMDPSPAYTTG